MAVAIHWRILSVAVLTIRALLYLLGPTILGSSRKTTQSWVMNQEGRHRLLPERAHGYPGLGEPSGALVSVLGGALIRWGSK